MYFDDEAARSQCPRHAWMPLRGGGSDAMIAQVRFIALIRYLHYAAKDYMQ